MKFIAAEERLNKTEFSNYDDWEIHPTTVYECPYCKKGLSLCFRDFEKHTFIDKFVSTIDKGDSNSFLDFACQGCDRPVRLYYTAWAGGRHGEAGFAIRFIIESKV